MNVDRLSKKAVADMKVALSEEPIPLLEPVAAHRRSLRLRVVAVSAGFLVVLGSVLTLATQIGRSSPPTATAVPTSTVPSNPEESLDPSTQPEAGATGSPDRASRSGTPISLFDPPASFPAGVPFHIAHGFGAEGASDTSISNMDAHGFELFVDGAQIFALREATLVGDRWVQLQWVFDFPEGLDVGAHTFRGVWIAPDSDDRMEERTIVFVE